MHYTRAYVDRAATETDGLLRFVAATEGVKGDGIDLRMDGALLERYRANPIFGYGHRYFSREDLPIGRAPEVKLVGKSLKIGVEFDQGDEFAKEVERKYRDGYLSAVSIGFDVTKWENGEGNYWRGGVAEEWELLEVSAVPVPMDAGAVVESGRARGLGLRELLAGVSLDPSVQVEKDPASFTRMVRVSEDLIERADPMLLAAGIARLLAEGAPAGGVEAAARALATVPYSWGMRPTSTDDLVAAVRSAVREEILLGFERGAIPAHNTAVAEGEWDGPGAVAKCPADAASLRAIHAWVDSSADKDAKSSYKLPHHATPGGPANLAGVRAALSRLAQAETQIPEGDQAAVKAHLQKHLDAQKSEDAHPGGPARMPAEPPVPEVDAGHEAAQLVAAIFKEIN